MFSPVASRLQEQNYVHFGTFRKLYIINYNKGPVT